LVAKTYNSFLEKIFFRQKNKSPQIKPQDKNRNIQPLRFIPLTSSLFSSRLLSLKMPGLKI